MLVLSKLRWSLPPVTAAEYVGALLPFFPIDRGNFKLATCNQITQKSKNHSETAS